MVMEKPKIYLETTMFSYYYEERTTPPYPKYKRDVRKIFDLIKEGVYETYTSPLATDEIIKDTNEEKREKMRKLIDEYNIQILPLTNESNRLADIYIQEKVISPKYRTDAMHIAVTSYEKLDYIVSLNFTHIVRAWTIDRVRVINAREHYSHIGIYKPSEVLEIYENTRRLLERSPSRRRPGLQEDAGAGKKNSRDKTSNARRNRGYDGFGIN